MISTFNTDAFRGLICTFNKSSLLIPVFKLAFKIRNQTFNFMKLENWAILSDIPFNYVNLDNLEHESKAPNTLNLKLISKKKWLAFNA